MSAKRIISVELPDSLRDALRNAAFQEDKSVSAVIRDTLLEKFGTKITKEEPDEH